MRVIRARVAGLGLVGFGLEFELGYSALVLEMQGEKSLTREARRSVSRHGFGLPAPRRVSSMNWRRAMKRRLHACSSKAPASAAVVVVVTTSASLAAASFAAAATAAASRRKASMASACWDESSRVTLCVCMPHG